MNEDVSKYAAILHAPHHVSKTHPHLSAQQRAAQFAPFAALSGYEEAIEETTRQVDEFPELGEETAAVLDARLAELLSRLETEPVVHVRLSYFVPDIAKEGGHIVTEVMTVRHIDMAAGLIYTTDGNELPLSRVLDLQVEG